MSSHPSSADVRRQFLDYFTERAHREVPSAPVFPQDDPTLLFTNAGMNQFKDVFLGTGTRDYTRAVDTQKCIRVSGKHNDLEEVGVDTYHHTFFEMLGNWSFGDYFKKDAITWAWGLLTEVWKLPKERLWVTVFAGDEKDGLPADEDAERLWRECTDIDPARVLRFDKTDNFWEMGDTGPCGPCSEIHIDRGEGDVDPADGANREIGVNAGNERFIELWNLVFMEFNRLDDGTLRKLPSQHVDTGMGFERVLSVLQGKRSNYDTDLFTPLFDRIGALVGKPYGDDEQVDIAFRVVADHLRAVTAAFADGALPSNTGRGYVLRRLLRRAARYGKQSLGVEDPFLFEIVPTVAEVLGGAFPEMRERTEHVQLLVREEEQSFHRTLGRGLVQFEKLAERIQGGGGRQLPGAEAFELYATYGFPQDLVELMARERELDVDLEGWSAAQEKHQAASRSEGHFQQLLSAEQLEGLAATDSTYHGDPADSEEVETEVLGHFPAKAEGGDDVLVLARSPFYPEGGGQVGDSGVVEAPDGSFRFEVRDTRKLGAIVAHVGSAGGSIERGATVIARADGERRDRTRRNHTGTHLLHRALREVLGDHVTQQGSYVGPDRLRFDFSHPRGVDPEELERVEAMVNADVFANATVSSTVEELEAAKERGVMALFGEKYDERVRVVEVGPSLELCGGTHVAAAGDIGPFVIVSESAIQAGVRRIEAVTGAEAVERIQAERRLLRETARSLKVRAEEIPDRLAQLQKQAKEAKKKQKQAAQADLDGVLDQVRAALAERDGLSTAIVDLPGLDTAALRELSGRAKSLAGDLGLVLLGRDGERVPFLAICTGAANDRGLRAGDLAKEIASVLGGGGGGKPQMAQGQGLSAEGVPQVLERIAARLAEA